MDASDVEALRHILDEGGISNTHDAIEALWNGRRLERSGLVSLGHEFAVLRVVKVSLSARDIARSCEKLRKFAKKAAKILDDDIGEACELNVALGAFGADTVKIAEALHLLDAAAYNLFLIANHLELVPPPKSEDAETWLFVKLYEIFRELSGKSEIGVHGPLLYRFEAAAVELLQTRGFGKIAMPNPEAFRKRLEAALKRRP